MFGFLYLISGVVTCFKRLCKCPQEGLFSSLSVLNVNSVLRQLPTSHGESDGCAYSWAEAVATHWLEDMVVATVQTYSVLSAFVGDSHSRELRIRRAS